MLLKMADFTQNPLDCPPDSPRTDQNGKLLKNAHIIGHFHCITRTVGKNEDVNRANKKRTSGKPSESTAGSNLLPGNIQRSSVSMIISCQRASFKNKGVS